jgi:hypothetical protein
MSTIKSLSPLFERLKDEPGAQSVRPEVYKALFPGASISQPCFIARRVRLAPNWWCSRRPADGCRSLPRL